MTKLTWPPVSTVPSCSVARNRYNGAVPIYEPDAVEDLICYKEPATLCGKRGGNPSQVFDKKKAKRRNAAAGVHTFGLSSVANGLFRAVDVAGTPSPGVVVVVPEMPATVIMVPLRKTRRMILLPLSEAAAMGK
jgi:hypothetical protein